MSKERVHSKKTFNIAIVVAAVLLLLCSFDVAHSTGRLDANAKGVLVLDGVNDSASASHSTDISIASDLTLECWFEKRSSGSADNGTTETLISKNKNYRLFLTWTTESTANITFQLWRTTSAYVQFTTSFAVSIADGTWVHVAAIFADSADMVAILVDGISMPLSTSSFTYALNTDTKNLIIGGESATSGINPYEGFIDDVRILSSVRYSSNFTPADVLSDSSAGTEAMYHFDEPSPLTDSSTVDSVIDTLTENNGVALKVDLSRFKAIPKGKKIVLKWKTDSETYNAGFNILRSNSKNGDYAVINNEMIESTANDAIGGDKYRYPDKNVKAGKKYFYKLVDIEIGGDENVNEQNPSAKIKEKSKRHKKHKKNR